MKKKNVLQILGFSILASWSILLVASAFANSINSPLTEAEQFGYKLISAMLLFMRLLAFLSLITYPFARKLSISLQFFLGFYIFFHIWIIALSYYLAGFDSDLDLKVKIFVSIFAPLALSGGFFISGSLLAISEYLSHKPHHSQSGS